MINQENVYSVLAFVTPGILKLLMDNRGIATEEAAALLYNSAVYDALRDQETGMWRLSSLALYGMLEEELADKIIDIPEEQ